MRSSKALCLCTLIALLIGSLAASAAQAKDKWVVEGKVLPTGIANGKQIEVTAAEPIAFEVPALHEEVQCAKAEYRGSTGTGHALIWNEEVAGGIVGRQEGLLKFTLCKNTHKTCTVAAAETLNTGSISGTLVNKVAGSNIYDMLAPEKWKELKPAFSSFEPFATISQATPCFSGTISATGLAGEILNESTESVVHTFKFLGKPACAVAPISEVEQSNGALDKIAMRVGSLTAEACAWMNIGLVSGEKWSVAA